jgi:predicted regulator of Ras-like GTPase activity (Roadblock/LC7/MglB family)
MKSRAGSQSRRRTMVDQEIPDLFNASGKPLAPDAAVPQTTAPAQQAPPPPPATVAPAPKKVPTNLSELFNEPAKKTWTPNEIVQYSAKLPNVAGTLIALQDGLLVAANMPPDLKTETIAAFVPQIFGRMNQYTTELQMGENSAVSFNVEAGTFQIYNAGIIYFAAFARKGQLLPLPELQLIAGELSRHTK